MLRLVVLALALSAWSAAQSTPCALCRDERSAVVTRVAISRSATSVTSSTARLNAASLTLDGLVNPDSLRTNCSDAARTSSSVAGGSKLKSVLMFRHIRGS